jgi:hypothetical protein
MLTIIPILTIASTQSPLRNARRRHTSTGARVAAETTVAATGKTGVRAGVRRKVAVTTTPDTTSFPVVGNGKGALAPCRSLPTSLDSGNSGSDIEISLKEVITSTVCIEKALWLDTYKDRRPDGERAGVVDSKRTSEDRACKSQSRSGDSKLHFVNVRM